MPSGARGVYLLTPPLASLNTESLKAGLESLQFPSPKGQKYKSL